jgi:pyruvate,water dikinase
MTFEDILRADQSGVAERRNRYESYRSFKAPNEIGSRFSSEHDPGATNGWSGIGASGGVVEGIARIAHNIEQALSVERGAILVCPFTDPGWTPVLDRVSGVVTETGGLLSHAAVICREYGIPAVLAVKNATQRIPAGKVVRVDGTSGQVEPGR